MRVSQTHMHQHTLLAHSKSKAIRRYFLRSVLLRTTVVIKSPWEESGETWIANFSLPRVRCIVVYLQTQASSRCLCPARPLLYGSASALKHTCTIAFLPSFGSIIVPPRLVPSVSAVGDALNGVHWSLPSASS